MKKTIIGAAIVILIIIGIVAVVMTSGEKDQNKTNAKTDTQIKIEKLETAEDMQKLLSGIYAKLGDKLPAFETRELDITDEMTFQTMTGLKSNEKVETVVVSEPFMSSQAYSAVLVKVSEGADIEKMKQEMLDNIDTNKWICVSAEKVYVTNYEDVIFLVMASEDWAKPVYNEFKNAVRKKYW